ncbi:MAG: LuxR C-terminal-related transcriptional regulator [Alphaproteobacteria bacterium]
MHILIADDHSIVRNGLKHLLSELADDVSFLEANSFEAAVDVALNNGSGPPDLLLIDLFAPYPVEADALRDLADKVAPSPIVIFSVSEDVRDMRRVLAAGARAYIPKTTDDTLFLSILRLVLAGGTYVPPAMGGLTDSMPEWSAAAETGMGAGQAASMQAGGIDRGRDERWYQELTPRQRDVLDMMAMGLSNKEIGERLELNINTVKGHVTAVLRALNADNRTQAVLMLKEGRAAK